MIKNNRVYGIIGIESKMSNWNADWENLPKHLSDGTIFGQDVAKKYADRLYWKGKGLPVLYIRELGQKMNILMLDENFTEKFKIDPKKEKDTTKILKCLFEAIDVMNFGGTFAIKNHNISITGAIQLGKGINKYEETEIITDKILSPFPSKAGKNMVTNGENIFTDEAHYFYSFCVNPNQYNEWKKILGEDFGYTQKAYDEFKEASLVSATALNTRSKKGSQNEFALFIELSEGSLLNLPDLTEYIKFYKEDEKNVIDLTQLSELLNAEKVAKEIDFIEIYYNAFTTDLEEDIKCKNKMKFNIITREKINE